MNRTNINMRMERFLNSPKKTDVKIELRDLSSITEAEQIEAEFYVYGIADPVGLLTLEEFKESLLGTRQDLRMTFLHSCKMYEFLKMNGFKIPF